jgi:hypothetical protein
MAISRLAVMVAMITAEDLNVEIALVILSVTAFVSSVVSFLLTDITFEEGMTDRVDRTERQIIDIDISEKEGAESIISVSSV